MDKLKEHLLVVDDDERIRELVKQYLIDYGIENNLFPNDFKSNKTLYTKTLNW